jgi:hypothetical protein
MRQKRRREYKYTTVTIDGEKKSLYLGKPSSSLQAREHQQKMEDKVKRKEVEQELQELHKAVDRALHALSLITRVHLLTIGLYQHRSELRKMKEEAYV